MSFPRYPKYKDSGVEWLGEVPEHWDIRRLKFLCDIQTGDKDTENAVEDGTFPFFVRSQTVERINSCSFDCEAILTAGDGAGVGKVFHYHKGPFDFHQRVYMLNKFRDVSGPFLFHFLRENFYKVALEGGAKSTVDSLRRPLFTNFPIAIPPDDEQQFVVGLIAAESQKIDELVAEQRRLIELLKEKRQAVISHAVTKGLNPNVPMKPSGIEWLGEVPEHWNCLQVGKVCQKVADGPHFSPNYVDEGVLFLSARNVKIDGWALDDVKYISESDCREFDRRIIPEPGDVLYTKGGTTGIARVVDLADRFQVWVHIAVLKVKREVIDPHFLAFALNSTACHEQSQLLTRGASNNDLGLTRMIKIWFVLPPIKEQRQIVDVIRDRLAKLDALTAEAERAIDLLQERRTALISAAVTGKIDVRGWVNAEGA